MRKFNKIITLILCLAMLLPMAPIVSTSAEDGANKALHISATEKQAAVSRTVSEGLPSDYTKKVSFDFSFATLPTKGIYFNFYGADGESRAWIGAIPSGSGRGQLFYYENGTKNITGAYLDANTWNHITLEWAGNSQPDAKLYINGELACVDVHVKSGNGIITKALVGPMSRDGSSDVYVDNIKFYTNGSNEPYFYDDFSTSAIGTEWIESADVGYVTIAETATVPPVVSDVFDEEVPSVNKALWFKGSGVQAKIVANAGQNLPADYTRKMSFDVLFNTIPNKGTYHQMNSSKEWIGICTSGNGGQLYYRLNNGTINQIGNTYMDKGVWYNVALEWESASDANASLYLDGTLVSDAIPLSSIGVISTVTSGSMSADGSTDFYIDNFKLFEESTKRPYFKDDFNGDVISQSWTGANYVTLVETDTMPKEEVPTLNTAIAITPSTSGQPTVKKTVTEGLPQYFYTEVVSFDVLCNAVPSKGVLFDFGGTGTSTWIGVFDPGSYGDQVPAFKDKAMLYYWDSGSQVHIPPAPYTTRMVPVLDENAAITLGKWNNITVVWDKESPTTATLYLNGVKVCDTVKTSGTGIINTFTFGAMTSDDVNCEIFVDNVRMYGFGSDKPYYSEDFSDFYEGNVPEIDGWDQTKSGLITAVELATFAPEFSKNNEMVHFSSASGQVTLSGKLDTGLSAKTHKASVDFWVETVPYKGFYFEFKNSAGQDLAWVGMYPSKDINETYTGKMALWYWDTSSGTKHQLSQYSQQVPVLTDTGAAKYNAWNTLTVEWPEAGSKALLYLNGEFVSEVKGICNGAVASVNIGSMADGNASDLFVDNFKLYAYDCDEPYYVEDFSDVDSGEWTAKTGVEFVKQIERAPSYEIPNRAIHVNKAEGVQPTLKRTVTSGLPATYTHKASFDIFVKSLDKKGVYLEFKSGGATKSMLGIFPVSNYSQAYDGAGMIFNWDSSTATQIAPSYDSRAVPVLDEKGVVTFNKWHNITIAWANGSDVADLYLDGAFVTGGLKTSTEAKVDEIVLGTMAADGGEASVYVDNIKLYGDGVSTKPYFADNFSGDTLGAAPSDWTLTAGDVKVVECDYAASKPNKAMYMVQNSTTIAATKSVEPSGKGTTKISMDVNTLVLSGRGLYFNFFENGENRLWFGLTYDDVQGLKLFHWNFASPLAGTTGHSQDYRMTLVTDENAAMKTSRWYNITIEMSEDKDKASVYVNGVLVEKHMRINGITSNGSGGYKLPLIDKITAGSMQSTGKAYVYVDNINFYADGETMPYFSEDFENNTTFNGEPTGWTQTGSNKIMIGESEYRPYTKVNDGVFDEFDAEPDGYVYEGNGSHAVENGKLVLSDGVKATRVFENSFNSGKFGFVMESPDPAGIVIELMNMGAVHTLISFDENGAVQYFRDDFFTSFTNPGLVNPNESVDFTIDLPNDRHTNYYNIRVNGEQVGTAFYNKTLTGIDAVRITVPEGKSLELDTLYIEKSEGAYKSEGRGDKQAPMTYLPLVIEDAKVMYLENDNTPYNSTLVYADENTPFTFNQTQNSVGFDLLSKRNVNNIRIMGNALTKRGFTRDAVKIWCSDDNENWDIVEGFTYNFYEENGKSNALFEFSGVTARYVKVNYLNKSATNYLAVNDLVTDVRAEEKVARQWELAGNAMVCENDANPVGTPMKLETAKFKIDGTENTFVLGNGGSVGINFGVHSDVEAFEIVASGLAELDIDDFELYYSFDNCDYEKITDTILSRDVRDGKDVYRLTFDSIKVGYLKLHNVSGKDITLDNLYDDMSAYSSIMAESIYRDLEGKGDGEGEFYTRPDGTIVLDFKGLADYEAGAEDFTEYAVMAVQSVDGGKTWSEPWIELHKRPDFLSIMQSIYLQFENGDLGILYTPHWPPEADPSWLHFRRSTDGGRTWDDPVVLLGGDETEGLQGVLSFASGSKACRLSNGRILVPVSYQTNHNDVWGDERSVVYVFYTDDEGYTWHLGKNSPTLKDAALEPSICEGKDGTVLMSFRVRYGGKLWQCTSVDGGLTWGEPEAVEGMVSASSTNSIVKIPQTGDTLLSWSNYLSGSEGGDPNKDDYTRDPLAMAVSADNGLTYGNVKNLIEGRAIYSVVSFYGRSVFINHVRRINVIDVSELYHTIYGNETVNQLDKADKPEAKYENGVLSGVSANMCYSLDGGESWKFAGGTSVILGEGYNNILVKDMGSTELAPSEVQTIE